MVAVESLNVKENIGRALGRIASGVFVLTTEANGARYGMLATWISQASFDPPAITVAVNKERGFLDSLGEGGTFTVNILSNRNTDVFKNFAKPLNNPEEDRFAKLSLLENPEGGPVFADCVACLNCQIKRFLDAGDHAVVLAEIKGGNIVNADLDPMVHFRKSGFQY